jgi:hypothetical protein
MHSRPLLVKASTEASKPAARIMHAVQALQEGAHQQLEDPLDVWRLGQEGRLLKQARLRGRRAQQHKRAPEHAEPHDACFWVCVLHSLLEEAVALAARVRLEVTVALRPRNMLDRTMLACE